MKEQENPAVWIVAILYIAAAIGLIAVFWQMPDGFSILGIGPHIREGNVSDYLTVLSVHFTTVFLVTGLMSMLGAEEEMVYDEDIVQKNLLQPSGRNFKELSVYAFTTLAMAVAAFACRSAYVMVLYVFVGTVVVSWIFFKTIDIYFGKERWQKKIAKEILKSEANDYRDRLLRLYGVLGRNLTEQDMEPLASNLALLVELKVYYRKEAEREDKSVRQREEAEKRGYIAGCMLDEIMERNGKLESVPVLELYVTMRGILMKQKKSECMSVLNAFFMDYVASHRGILEDRHRNAVIRAVFGFDEDDQTIKDWIDGLKESVKSLKEKDFRAPDTADGKWRESRFVELARETCQARLLSTFHDMRVCFHEFGRSLFYEEIAELVKRDEERAGDSGFQYPTGIYCDENEGEAVYFREYHVEEEMREGLFVRWFPRYAVLYGGERAASLLEEFFDAYREYAKGENPGPEYAFEYYSIVPPNPAVYDRIRICYLQGCAEQVMKGIPGTADTVAGLVVHFWEEAQYYKQPAEWREFCRFSFGHIGAGLLYADDSAAGRRYNERPECMLRFMKSLIRRVRAGESLQMDMGETFGEFLDRLKSLCPRYYSAEVAEKVEELIWQE